MKNKVRILLLGTIFTAIINGNASDKDFPEKIFMNLSADPCDDFYKYTCGNYKNVYPLENNISTIDQFVLLGNHLIDIVKNILSEENHIYDPEALKKSRSVYKACIDTYYLDAVKNPERVVIAEQHGFPLIQPQFIRETVKYTFYDIADAVSRYGIPMLFSTEAYSNIYNGSNNLLIISSILSEGLFPTTIYPKENQYDDVIKKGFLELSRQKDFRYLHHNLNSTNTLQPFDLLLRRLAFKMHNAEHSLLDADEIFNNIEDMAAFMRRLFNDGDIGSKEIADFTNFTLTLKQLNDWTKEQFGEDFEFDWVQYFQHLTANSGIHISEETEVMSYDGLARLLYGILNLVRKTEDHIVKSYVMMRIFIFMTPDSDAESRKFIDDYFDARGIEIFPRWKYCTRKIIDPTDTAGLSFAVAYEYQLRHFNVNNFEKATEMIRNIQSVYRTILQDASWMDAESRATAIEKFDNMITILGHPDISFSKEKLDRFYENLGVCNWDHYGNSFRIRAFKQAYQLSQLAKRDRAFWDKSPFEVNAYYTRSNNKMTFPIAMLNPVFFGNDNSILDYARIGSIIGHEMTHGFDAEGMKYDANGTYKAWWSNETKLGFNNKTACFVNEYNQFYIPDIDSWVNGSLTLNENIADNGGARAAFKAMKKLFTENPHLTGSDNEFTAEQLYFIGFGTLWCNNPSIKYQQSMQYNAHTNNKYRVNGVVSNMNEFAEAFNCPVGSNMNPQTKCQLW